MSAEAELVVLRLGFEEGLFSRDDVRAWVGRELVRLSELPGALLELSVLAHKPDHEVVALLRALEPELPAEATARLDLTVLGALYATGKISLREVVSRLNSMASFGQGLSETERSVIYELDATHDLAAEGIYSTLEDVREQVRAFLSRYPLPPAQPR